MKETKAAGRTGESSSAGGSLTSRAVRQCYVVYLHRLSSLPTSSEPRPGAWVLGHQGKAESVRDEEKVPMWMNSAQAETLSQS